MNIVLAPAVGFILDQSGHNYRYTFFMGFALAVVSIVLFVLLYRRFLQYGGPTAMSLPSRNYTCRTDFPVGWRLSALPRLPAFAKLVAFL